MHFKTQEFAPVFYAEYGNRIGEIEFKIVEDNLNIDLNNETFVVQQELDQLSMKKMSGEILFRIYFDENTINNFLVQENEEERSYECQKVGLLEEYYEYHKTIVTPEKRIYSKTLRTKPKYGKKYIHFKVSSLEEDGMMNTFLQNRKYTNLKIERYTNIPKQVYLEEVFSTLEEQSIKNSYSHKFIPSF